MNGTLINAYIHCKTQCWLLANQINLTAYNEYVNLGNIIHEENKTKSIFIDNISIDDMNDEYIIEVKKSTADLEAGRWQLLYYLFELSKKGIVKKGLLKSIDPPYEEEITLTREKIEKLENLIKEIEKLISQPSPPIQTLQPKCKKCSFYDFCFL